MRRLVLVACCLGGAPAHAAEIDRLDIRHHGERYQMQLEARLDAPLTASYATFRAFENLPRINDAVEAVQPLAGAPAGAQRLYTRVRICVWLFCKQLEQVQDLREADNGAGRGLDATVIPALSNLRYGRAHWRMRDCAPQTCLTFTAELEPAFWVPPLIGPWAIERAMRREALQTATGIERLARQEPDA